MSMLPVMLSNMDETNILKSMDKSLKGIENRLSALLALTAVSAFGSAEERRGIKPEVILHHAGLENAEIAKVLGKKLGAVQKSLQRSKK